MKARWALAALLLLVGLAIHVRRHAPSALAEEEPRSKSITRSSGISTSLVGAGSCAAAACHHNNDWHGALGSEYTTWVGKDRHAKAYEVLFDERSLRIQKNLQSSTPSHQEQRCLACHVHPEFEAELPPPNAPYFKTDGVSCEACHGPAKQWLSIHHLEEWKLKTSAEKKKLGMTDTQSLVGRARVCTSCHVGAPGMDVDHDLIAAGHPRLNFEFTAFHANLPRHWPDAKDRDPKLSSRGRVDFEARAWVVGQWETTRAALELLAFRADVKNKVWPEFVEHDCFACHHDLQASGRGRGGQDRPLLADATAIPFSVWYWGIAPEAFKADKVEDLAYRSFVKELSHGWRNRAKISHTAKQAADRLQRLLDLNEEKLAEPDWQSRMLHEILDRAARQEGASWDQAAQTYLALAALHSAPIDAKTQAGGENRAVLRGLHQALEFPRFYESPKNFDASAIQKRLVDFQTLVRKKGQ